MEPIDLLTQKLARGIDTVCFDIDDTITTHGVLASEAYASLFALKAAGLRLIAVTGRPLGWAELFARTWPIDVAVGENGAGYIAKEDGKLVFGYWNDAPTRLSQAQKLGQIRERVARELPELRVASDSWARRCDLAFDVNEFERVPPARVDALVAILREEAAHVTVSSVHAHAQLGDHDKAQGVVRAARELFGVDAAHVKARSLFVGDSGNDAAAFAWFDVTAGVANVVRSLARLPVPPRYLAQAEYGAGFAEIAATLIARRAQ